MDIRCPRCQSQQTAKASAIINAGTAKVSTKGTGTGVSFGRGGIAPTLVNYSSTTHTRSILAQKLAPPRRPRMKSSTSQGAILVVVFGVLILCSFPFILLIIKQHDATDISLLTYMLIICGVFICFCLFPAVLSIIRTMRTAPQRKAEHQAKIARWQHAMYNWNLLYY